METEVELPPSIPSPSATVKPSLNLNPSRKRSRHDYEVTSSDPPLFSSDDLPSSSIENYTSQRNKPQYESAWWGSRHQTSDRPIKQKRQFKRNMDSGVFMSDGTESSFSGFEDELQGTIGHSQNAVRRRFQVEDRGAETMAGGKRVELQEIDVEDEDCEEPQGATIESRELTRAGLIIQRCLEDGNEEIDIS